VIGTALGGMEAAANVAVTSLPIAAVALGFGAYHLSPLPRRYLHPRLSFALLWLGAFGVAGAVARLCWLVGAPAPGGMRVALFVSLIMFGSMTSGTLRRQWADRRIMGPLEHTFARPAARQVSGIVNILYGMAVLVLALSLRPGAWAGCYYAVMMALGAYMLSRLTSPVEFHTGGVSCQGYLYPWRSLGKFEWMPGKQTILRINRGSRNDIRVTCPENPTIEAILTAHGLVRY
jgi:hypothetical protein